MKISDHANSVVTSFKASLTPEQLEVLSEEDFGSLQILVEAALGSTTSKAIHDMAKNMELLAKQARNQAASIERLET
jgi:hypothetical protein